MRIVVTGALGHIGSRLIRELAVTWPGAHVVMLDNLASERYASLYDLSDACRYEFIEGDVLDADLDAVFTGADAAVHLAALTNSARIDRRDQMEQVNVVGTERVARSCAALNVPLLFPSTTSVYGVANGVVEEDGAATVLTPQSPYAELKLRAEEMLRAIGREHGLRYVIFRMGTIFGPSVGMRFHTAVNQFCWRAVSGQPVEVWQTASHQFRPYLDLADAVTAMLFVIRRRQFDARVYNVATLNATVAHVVEVLASFVPHLRINYVESPLMNTLSYHVDTTRFSGLGFEFTGSLARGIGDTITMLTGAGRRYEASASDGSGRTHRR